MSSLEIAAGVFVEDRGFGIAAPLLHDIGNPALHAVMNDTAPAQDVGISTDTDPQGHVGDDEWEHHVSPVSLFY